MHTWGIDAIIPSTGYLNPANCISDVDCKPAWILDCSVRNNAFRLSTERQETDYFQISVKNLAH